MGINPALEDILLGHPEVAQAVFGMEVKEFVVADPEGTVTAYWLRTSKDYKGWKLTEALSDYYGKKTSRKVIKLGFKRTIETKLLPDEENCLEIKTLKTETNACTRKIAGITNLTGNFKEPLTGLWNERYWQIFAKEAYNAGSRRGTAYVVMIDIDNLKGINDSYGHETGNSAIIEVAKTLREHFKRETDILVRRRGDEFELVAATDKAKLKKC